MLWAAGVASVVVVAGIVAGVVVGLRGGGGTSSQRRLVRAASGCENQVQGCGGPSPTEPAAPNPPATPPPSTTTSTTLSPAQFEATCTTTMTFGQMSSPDAPQGTCITGQAQVFQFDSNTGPTSMLIDVTNDGYGFWSDAVELELPSAAVGEGIVENDVIEYWGTLSGTDTYQTTAGGTNTVPVIHAAYVDVVSGA